MLLLLSLLATGSGSTTADFPPIQCDPKAAPPEASPGGECLPTVRLFHRLPIICPGSPPPDPATPPPPPQGLAPTPQYKKCAGSSIGSLDNKSVPVCLYLTLQQTESGSATARPPTPWTAAACASRPLAVEHGRGTRLAGPATRSSRA